MSLTLMERYIIARWAYSIGEEYMSDMEYNRIHKEISEMFPDNEYVNRTWSDDPCPTELLYRERLTNLCKTIRLTHSSESIYSITSESEFRDTFFGLRGETRLSYKEDGWNISVDYYDGLPIFATTRGRATNGKEASTILSIVPQIIPVKGKVKIYGELTIPNDKWKMFSLETGNTSQRSSVSTALADGLNDSLNFSAFNMFIENEEVLQDKYQLLKNWGFITPQFVLVDSFDKLDKAIDLLGKRRKAYPRPTDGLVAENDKTQVAIRIRAYEESTHKSYVTGYTENSGIYGYAIVCNIYPVKIDGTTHDKINVTNLDCIKYNNLRVGYPIAFSIRSGVNPVLDITKTDQLQKEYLGNYNSYCKSINPDFIKL